MPFLTWKSQYVLQALHTDFADSMQYYQHEKHGQAH